MAEDTRTNKVSEEHSDAELPADTFWDAYWTLDEEWRPRASGRGRHIEGFFVRRGEPLILF